jgi:hypothetical protein
MEKKLNKWGGKRESSGRKPYTTQQVKLLEIYRGKKSTKFTSDCEKAKKLLIKERLWSLRKLDEIELLECVQGPKPSCFGQGDWDKLSNCTKCEQVGDAFFLNGKEIGKSSWDLFGACLMANWLLILGDWARV